MYFLIDYENVNYAGLEGTEFIEQNDKVYFFFSKASEKIVSYRLRDVINSRCYFEICKLKNTRKNALDFYIASKVGEIFALERDAKVAIISADKDYQAVIDYWKPRLAVQNQLVRAKTIAAGIKQVNGEGSRKALVDDRMKILNLEEEYVKFEERNRIRKMLEELFTDTEYENFISKIIDIVMANNKPRKLYLDSLKSFGKKVGTEVYWKIKDCVSG